MTCIQKLQHIYTYIKWKISRFFPSIMTNPYVIHNEKERVPLSLSVQEIRILRATWNETLSGNESGEKTQYKTVFCKQLYRNLLGLSPNLDVIFPNIKHLANALAGVIQMTIMHLENIGALDDYLDSLGKRHSRILGIEPAQFDLMGAALMMTFTDRLGAGFTNQIEDAWIKVYMYLANTMLQNGTEDVMIVSEERMEEDFEYQSSTASSAKNDTGFADDGSTASSIEDMASTASYKNLRLKISKKSSSNLKEMDQMMSLTKVSSKSSMVNSVVTSVAKNSVMNSLTKNTLTKNTLTNNTTMPKNKTSYLNPRSVSDAVVEKKSIFRGFRNPIKKDKRMSTVN